MFRGISLRHLSLLLLGPMLAETLSMFFTPWYVYQATYVLMLDSSWTGLIPAAGSLGYTCSSLIAGRWVTPRIAPFLMVGSIVLVTTFGLTGMALYNYWAFLACAFLASSAIGHYYTPFQINMTHVQPFRTLAFSVGFYNIAWGTGAAVGPLVGSSLSAAPMTSLAITAGAILFVHTALNIQAYLAPRPDHEEHATAAFASTGRQRMYAMVCFIAVAASVRGLYMPLWPALGREFGWSDWQVGLGQCAVFAPLPLLSLLWARMRRRLVHPWIMLGSLALAFVGFGGLYFTSSWPVAMVLAFMTGIGESCVVFHAIYYMNADPNVKRRSRNVGLFEMTAGATNVAGPIILGVLASGNPTGPMPYGWACVTIAAATAWVAWSELRGRGQKLQVRGQKSESESDSESEVRPERLTSDR